MPDRASSIRKLDVIRAIAAVDTVMLVVLLAFSFSGNRGGVHVLGPIHGLVVLLLLYLTGVGMAEKRWSWVFPLTTLIPVLALIYDVRLRRGVVAAS